MGVEEEDRQELYLHVHLLLIDPHRRLLRLCNLQIDIGQVTSLIATIGGRAHTEHAQSWVGEICPAEEVLGGQRICIELFIRCRSDFHLPIRSWLSEKPSLSPYL